MAIILTLIIAFSIGVFFYFNRFKEVDAVDMLPAICGVVVLLYFISNYVSSSVQNSDWFITNHPITTATYYEPWDEAVPCRHPRYQESCSGEGTNRTCTQIYVGNEHLYDVDFHPARWDSTCFGDSQSITQTTFEQLASRWKNRTFVDLRRNYHSIDGDKYVTNWPSETWEIFEMCYVSHMMDNHAKYTIRELEIKNFVYEYSKEKNVQGWGDSKSFDILNAKSGSKNLRFHLLVYRNQAANIFQDQKIKWRGGKASDFVIGVGIDSSNKPIWADVFSWTENEMLKSEVRGYVMTMETLNTSSLASFLENNSKYWRFNDLKRYEYIEPPTLKSILVLQFLLIIGVLCATIYTLKEQLRRN